MLLFFAVKFEGITEWIVLAILALWMATLIEVIISKFPTSTQKWTWILVVFLFGLIGCIIYFFVGRKHRIK